MRILRRRRGFQADHSSSSYLFYAADQEVSAAGQRVAHRFSSRAEVNERTARYHKWGESSLNGSAYRELLAEHYDVMVSESYDWWTLMIAVPKTAELERRLAPFREAQGYEDLGVVIDDYGPRLVVSVYCSFDYSGPAFDPYEDNMEQLADLLVKIRHEIMTGNLSFLHAVAEFYDAELAEPDEPEDAAAPQASEDDAAWRDSSLRKADLQQECRRRGIAFRKSWTKDQLRGALEEAASEAASESASETTSGGGRPGKLSRAANRIVATLQKI